MPGYPCCCHNPYIDIVYRDERMRIFEGSSTPVSLWTAGYLSTDNTLAALAPSFSGGCLLAHDGTGGAPDREYIEVDLLDGSYSGVFLDGDALPGTTAIAPTHFAPGGLWQECNGYCCAGGSQSGVGNVYVSIDSGGSVAVFAVSSDPTRRCAYRIGGSVYYLAQAAGGGGAWTIKKSGSPPTTHVDFSAAGYAFVHGMVSDGTTLYALAHDFTNWYLLSINTTGTPAITVITTVGGTVGDSKALTLLNGFIYIPLRDSGITTFYRYEIATNTLETILSCPYDPSMPNSLAFVCEDGT